MLKPLVMGWSAYTTLAYVTARWGEPQRLGLEAGSTHSGLGFAQPKDEEAVRVPGAAGQRAHSIHSMNAQCD